MTIISKAMPSSMGSSVFLSTCKERYYLVLMSSSLAKLITPRNSMMALGDSAALIEVFSEVRSWVIGSIIASLTKRSAPSFSASG